MINFKEVKYLSNTNDNIFLLMFNLDVDILVSYTEDNSIDIFEKTYKKGMPIVLKNTKDLLLSAWKLYTMFNDYVPKKNEYFDLKSLNLKEVKNEN